jgi:hypothetical protein
LGDCSGHYFKSRLVGFFYSRNFNSPPTKPLPCPVDSRRRPDQRLSPLKPEKPGHPFRPITDRPARPAGTMRCKYRRQPLGSCGGLYASLTNRPGRGASAVELWNFSALHLAESLIPLGDYAYMYWRYLALDESRVGVRSSQSANKGLVTAILCTRSRNELEMCALFTRHSIGRYL